MNETAKMDHPEYSILGISPLGLVVLSEKFQEALEVLAAHPLRTHHTVFLEPSS